jgi:phosphate transport system substrate-binding protein
VAAISRGDSEAYQPYQAYVAQNLYPLIREVVIVSREARTGLGSGFFTYVANDKGQRVVLKAGLVPATMPVRIVEINYGQN